MSEVYCFYYYNKDNINWRWNEYARRRRLLYLRRRRFLVSADLFLFFFFFCPHVHPFMLLLLIIVTHDFQCWSRVVFRFFFFRFYSSTVRLQPSYCSYYFFVFMSQPTRGDADPRPIEFDWKSLWRTKIIHITYGYRVSLGFRCFYH